VYTHACIHIQTHIHIHVCMSIRMYVCTYIQTYVEREIEREEREKRENESEKHNTPIAAALRASSSPDAHLPLAACSASGVLCSRLITCAATQRCRVHQDISSPDGPIARHWKRKEQKVRKAEGEGSLGPGVKYP
jgi:hypothetical protein